MVLQAALAALLTRLGAGTDIPIGSPIAGRTDSALDDLVGFFVNTLVLRTDTSGNPSFRELIGAGAGEQSGRLQPPGPAVRAAGGGAQPGALAVAASAVPGDAGVAEQRARSSFELAGADRTASSRSRRRSAKFDLSLSLGEQRGADGTPAGIDGVLEYATDLFDRASVEALAGRLRSAAGGGGCRSRSGRSAASTFWPPTSATPSCASGTTPRARSRPPPCRSCSPRRSRARPMRSRWCSRTQSLTYGELDARANQLAHHLRALGVGPEVVVGLCVERSLEMVVGLLGILKAGGAYLPLDPDYPPERLAFMLADAGAPVLVTQSALLDRLPAHGARVVLPRCRRGRRSPADPPTAPARRARPDNPPMSSTPRAPPARPKGVSTHHRNVANLSSAQWRIFRCGLAIAY